MADIVDRLREWSSMHNPRSGASLITTAAADEIERLRSLITAWADADDALVALFGTSAAWDTVNAAEKRSDATLDALREAVGR